MSKIGEKAIIVPAGVQIAIEHAQIAVKGSKGALVIPLPREINVEQVGTELLVKRTGDDKGKRSKHGLFRSLIANAVVGVETEWQKRLDVIGTGFNVKLQGQSLIFKVGYSHTVNFQPVPGIKYGVEGTNKVIVSGVNKQLVGQVAFQIKMIRKPDVYKGKGIRYEGEVIKLKAGKKAKA